MSILIYLALILSSGSICRGFLSEDTYLYKSYYPVRIGNNEPVIKEPGFTNNLEGRVIRNPNDPKYQKIAKDFVHSQLRIKEEDTINITLYKVTTTADSGQIIRFQFRVFLLNAQSIGCRAKIWEQPWQNVEHISYCCETLRNNKISSDHNDNPRPDNHRYHELVRVSLKAWFTIDGQKPFKEADIKAINVTKVKTEITSEVINVIYFNVVTLNNIHFNCIGRIMDIPWDPEDTMPFPEIKCNIDRDITDSREWTEISIIEEIAQTREVRDHNDIKYQQLATESAVSYFNSSANKVYKIYEINMESVIGITTRIHRNEIIYINFDIVAANTGTKTGIFNCSSVYENLELKMKLLSLHCIEYPYQQGASYWENPSGAKYEVAAKKSLKKYLENSGNHLDAADVIVTFVVKRLVKESIYDINFIVRTSQNHKLECYSSVWDRKKLEVETVRCKQVNGLIHSSEMQLNPDEPKYKYLAEESFEKYKESNMSLIQVRDFKVTRVTTQIAFGEITRIDFFVIPTVGKFLQCHSEIREQGPLQKKDITVACHIYEHDKHQQPGGEVQQNPQDPKFKYLAEEAFEKYKESNMLLIQVRDFKVTRVTTQIAFGEITRIDFFVIPTDGKFLPCHSEIREQGPLQKKDITVTCHIYEHDKHQQPGGEVQQDRDDPKYKYLAEEAFEKYRKSRIDLLIQVRELNVTRVTTQVASGKRTRIDFLVIPINGNTFSCISEIWEHQAFQKKDISVTCDYDIHQKPAGQVLQNPNDPKYKYLAEESFEKYRKLHIGLLIDGRELKVTRVTTQVVSGVITRIDFNVIPVAGKSFPCHSEIWENQALLSKDITVICDYDKNKLLPEGLVQENPNAPIYKYWAEESFEKYRKSHIGVLFEVGELKVTRVTTQIFSGVIIRIDFNVVPIKGETMSCHSVIWEHSALQEKDITVNCDYVKYLQPGNQWLQNPNEPKYKHLAEEAFEKYKKSHIDLLIEVRELKVTRVTTQIVAGLITRIDFSVIPVAGESFPCHSEIWEHQSLQNKHIAVICDKHLKPGDQVQQNPNEPKYKSLAEEAFERYRKSHIGVLIEVRELKVTRVTTEVVAGEIIRIDFFVIPTDGKSFPCHSEIRKQGPLPLQNKDITVTCDFDEHQQPGGQIQQNPDEPKYTYLANEAFEKYRKSHVGFLFDVRELRVTRVTTQIVFGIITRIDFNIISIKGEAFPCHSEIWEYQRLLKKDIAVTCDYDKHQKPDGQVQQRPDNPKYRHLAEESFEKYRNSHFGFIIDVKELNVTKVTTQEVLGVITRIDFSVIPIKGQTFACHSEIWEAQTLQKKDIAVTCDYDKYKQLLDIQVQQNLDDPTYKQLAKESFEKYRKSHNDLLIEVREFKVTRVTTQVVSGIITRIVFIVIPTKGDSFPCLSEIHQRQSLQEKQIIVTCDYYEYKQLHDDQVQQNPDNLVYKQLADESFQNFLKYHSNIRLQIKGLKVIRATTQLHGKLIRIDFHVYPTEGRTIPCYSEIRKLLHKSDFTVECQIKDLVNYVDQEKENPDDPKYKELTEQSFEKYRSQIGLFIKVDELKVTRVIKQVISNIITTTIDFNVIPMEGTSFPCRSEIREQQLLHTKEIIVGCDSKKYQLLPNDQVKQTSDSHVYKILAEEAFEKFLKSHTNIKIKFKDLKVAKVTTQGTVKRIHFHVYPTKGHTVPCYCEIREQNHKKNITVQCQLNQHLKPGHQEVQDPNDPKYKHLIEQSFEKYRSQIGVFVKVHELKVIRVTSEVVSGVTTTRIDFKVILAEGDSFPCHSEIMEQQLLQEQEIIVTCNHERYKLLPGGQVPQDPDNPEYKLLAEDAFKKFLKTYSIGIEIESLKVTKVTTEIVSEKVIRIDFQVYPVKGRTIPCHTEIRKQLDKTDFNVQCKLNEHDPSDQKEQDPNDPKYKYLAEESFEIYRSQERLLIEVEELKVTRVTKSAAMSGVITRIDFNVIPIIGKFFSCHSEIWDMHSPKKKEITVKCETHTKHSDLTLSLSKHSKLNGKKEQDPKNPKYKHLAEESFEIFQKYKSGPSIRVQKLIVTKVITQIVSLSAIKTYIDFKVTSTKNKLFNCHSEIHEIKSLQKKDKQFKVECDERQTRGK